MNRERAIFDRLDSKEGLGDEMDEWKRMREAGCYDTLLQRTSSSVDAGRVTGAHPVEQ